MPTFLPIRLPLPSLKSYVIASFGTSIITLLYIHLTLLPNRQHTNIFRFEQPLDMNAIFRFFLSTILRESWTLLVALNMMHCLLVLLGRVLMWFTFNTLHASEIQMARDKLWNFAFYKFIFVFGIMNVQEVPEMVGWFGWFSVLAFIHTFTNVSNHRIRLYASSPATPRKDFIKLFILLLLLTIASTTIFITTTFSNQPTPSIYLFTLAESLILFIKTSYVFTKLLSYLSEEWLSWRAADSYYTDLVFELSILCIDFLHHLHMLLYGNIFLSMAALVVSMQLRQLFQALKSRLYRHLNFQRVVHNMQNRFPLVEAPDEQCAICWEPLKEARKLPCSHCFHNNCLRSWLEQDVSCPTCRNNLRTPPTTTTAPSPPNPPPSRPFYNRFHFDGSRIFNWLPSFSLEVFHRRSGHDSSALNNMVWQVREIFPHHPIELIRADLRNTLSIHATIENIAEGRLPIINEDHYREARPTSTTNQSSSSSSSSSFSSSSAGNLSLSTIRSRFFIARSSSQNNNNINNNNNNNRNNGFGDVISRSNNNSNNNSSNNAYGDGGSSSSSSSSSSNSGGSSSNSSNDIGKSIVKALTAEIHTSEDTHTNTHISSNTNTDTNSDTPNNAANIFSSEPETRQKLLKNRKMMMLEYARRKFLRRSDQELEGSSVD